MKLYAPEEGSDQLGGLGPVVVSELARVEVPAALWRKHRRGALSAASAALLTRRFEADLYGARGKRARFAFVTLGGDILRHAAAILPSHALRAADAIQLASALAARQSDPNCRTFACFDGTLRAAAVAEGFRLVP